MGDMEISFRSTLRNSTFLNGKIERDLAAYEHDVASAIADSGKDAWVHNLQGSIRNPTPYYWTRISKREISPTLYEIHDHGIVYGPWLEGTGSRNSPVTVFPGYHSLERAKEITKKKRSNIARRILRRYRSSGRLI